MWVPTLREADDGWTEEIPERLAGKLVTRFAAGKFGNARNNLRKSNNVAQCLFAKAKAVDCCLITKWASKAVQDTCLEAKPSPESSVGVKQMSLR